MKALFDKVSWKASKLTTTNYSTSFSLGIRFLDKKFHNGIYGIYGFLRFADEIVDTFHGYPQEKLLEKFSADTYEAIEDGISLNPILNSFQAVVNQYGIEKELIDTFLDSMRRDLDQTSYDMQGFQEYILGSAEVVGLMCLRVFVEGDDKQYQELKPTAMALGSAFQKVNFLRDIKDDYQRLGRTYFPDVKFDRFDRAKLKELEEDINKDFDFALQGIRKLPKGARLGVYTAYIYYKSLMEKIVKMPTLELLESRIRIPNQQKVALFIRSYVHHNLNRI